MDTVPLKLTERRDEEISARAHEFADELVRRRTVRDFSSKAIPPGVLEDCLRAAGSAPSGANLQPWHFAVVTSPALKHQIRQAAEGNEREFYEKRAPDRWLKSLAPLGTTASKPFLERAPALIAVFQKSSVTGPDGQETATYYAKESVGIATGFLIAALHRAGLASLTHTPSPMAFLNSILNRPCSEKPFLLLVVGFPVENCSVPSINRQKLNQITSWH
ncbi:MAG: nitroreductase family protein [Verrucomicrobiales bacterium]